MKSSIKPLRKLFCNLRMLVNEPGNLLTLSSQLLRRKYFCAPVTLYKISLGAVCNGFHCNILSTIHFHLS